MSDINELDLLKQRAQTLGISFHPSIGLEALKAKVSAKLHDDSDGPQNSNDDGNLSGDPSDLDKPDDAFVSNYVPTQRELQRSSSANNRQNKMAALAVARKNLRLEQLRLVRIRVACLNPSKKEWQGEIFTFVNSVLGEVKKFVPFGEGSENGYHVPFCIYQLIKDRKFVQLRNKKVRNAAGIDQVSQKVVSEFSVEILPDLTPKEIATLAAGQAAGNNID